MTQLVFLATTNPGKLTELQQLFGTSKDWTFALPPAPLEIEETGQSFRENARLKAVDSARHYGVPCLADDSGLVVNALEGRPGIYSARYAATNEARIQRVLHELQGVPASQRQAAFVCAMCLAFPDGRMVEVEGRCEGVITESPFGQGGFGYDPIFWVPEYQQTFGELSPEVKNRISHRAVAALRLQEAIATGHLSHTP